MSEPTEDSKVVEEELKKLRIPDDTSTQPAKQTTRKDPSEDLCEVLNRCLATTCRAKSSNSNSFLTITKPSSSLLKPRTSCRSLIRRSRLNILKRCQYLRKPKLNFVKFNYSENEPSNICEESVTKNTPVIQSTCSQQAMNPCPNEDDTSIEELAAYFDCLVHIPKKMSQMAEMMYT